jgi:parallel beta-helix repeat protein
MFKSAGKLRKIASCLIVTSLFLSLLAFAFNIQTVKASGTIYIRADGSIEGTTNIQTADNVTYVLTANLSDSIVVQRENIIINGMNYTLQGTGDGTGISLSGKSNITIKNTNIKYFYYGVFLYSSSNNSVNENNITANSVCGIYLYGSSNNSLSGNNIANNYGGIYLSDCPSNNVSENSIANNSEYGFWLDSSSNNSVSGNNIANNNLGIYLYGSSNNNSIRRNTFFNDGLVVNSYGNTVVDNLVNGKPLVYLEGVSDYSVKDAGQVILVNCNRIIVENLTLSNTDVALELWQTNNTKISGNNITANSYYGIRLYSCSNNSVSGNNITANSYYGIRLYSCSNNSVSGNNIANNNLGIYLYSSSDNNSIIGNNITANKYGFWLDFSSNNSISGNRVKGNVFGVRLDYSSSNKIYHNDFINNEHQTFLLGTLHNAWDDGYPSGGNYWSDYGGVDLKSGPFQNETGSDGIGDTPYIFNGKNTDNYPLMKPYVTVHDIGLRVSISKPVIFVGYNLITTMNVTIMNYGVYAESFNFTSEIGTTKEEQTITLVSLNSTTITFTWNTTGLAKGNYTISAYAQPVIGEKDTADNNWTGSVFITKVGDLGSRVGSTNKFGVPDNLVTSSDLNLLLQCYKATAPTADMYLGDLGSRVEVSPGPPPVYANEFFVCDGLVTSTDLSLFLQCYTGQGPPDP